MTIQSQYNMLKGTLIILLIWYIIEIFSLGYLFWRLFNEMKKEDTDSYSTNDDKTEIN